MKSFDIHIWLVFIAGIIALVIFDLWMSRGNRRPATLGSALKWSAFWVGLSLAFGGLIGWLRGSEVALDFYTAYLLEKVLSVDNLFVFLLLFKRFEVPEPAQHRVLTYGIFTAIVLRAVMIGAGIEILHAYHAVIYGFAALLIWAGVKTFFHKEDAAAPDPRRLMGLVEKIIPIDARFHGGRFFVRRNGRRVGTLLLLVLIFVELADIMFAVDSIPAVFAVTEDAFIVFSSNILAVLGLRTLYFALAGALQKLRYLRHGLAVLLVLIGAKMALSSVVHLSGAWSLFMTLFVLAITIVASLAGKAPHARPTADAEQF